MQLLDFLDVNDLNQTITDWASVTGLCVLMVDNENNIVIEPIGDFSKESYTLNDPYFEVTLDNHYYGKVMMKSTGEITSSDEVSIQLLKHSTMAIIQNAYNAYQDSERIETLNARISKITTIIHEIQENSKELDKLGNKQKILALNASIEAARAGDAGKGFAIVASNVADLASNSTRINTTIKESLDALTELLQDVN